MEDDTKRRKFESEEEKEATKTIRHMLNKIFPIIKDDNGNLVQSREPREPHLVNVFIKILAELELPLVYTIYESDNRLRMFFRSRDVWQTLCRMWYPDQIDKMTNIIKPAVPPGKRINYLWLMLAHYVASNGYKQFSKMLSGESISVVNSGNDGAGYWFSFKQYVYTLSPTVKIVTLTRSTFTDTKQWYNLVSIAIKQFGIRAVREAYTDSLKITFNYTALARTVYELMATVPSARITIPIGDVEYDDGSKKYLQMRSQIK